MGFINRWVKLSLEEVGWAGEAAIADPLHSSSVHSKTLKRSNFINEPIKIVY
ncbi:MAG: hypothetical protein ABI268_11440 [Rhodanobacter sp.]